MTDNSLAKRQQSGVIEQVLVGGDLSKLSPEQRVAYYMRVCDSMGLNPYTKPFEYISLNGKLTLYARKDATDQLRQRNGISIDKPDIRLEEEWIIVTVTGHNTDGRTDSDIGVVNKKDMRGDFGNALMKAVTKAKRRLTLSICGLGMLDETEIETIPNAVPVDVNIPEPTVTIIDPTPTPEPTAQATIPIQPAYPPEWDQARTNATERTAIVTDEARPAKKRQPLIKSQGWFAVAAELAQTFEEYQDKNGKPNNYHLLAALAEAGYTEINDANLPEVKQALIDHMLAKRA